MEDLIADETMAVSISHEGYIKRHPVSEYRAQRRGGKGKIGMGVKEQDFVEKILRPRRMISSCSLPTRERCIGSNCMNCPKPAGPAKARPMVNLLALGPEERVTTTLPVREFPDDLYVVMATRKGYIKKTKLSAYGNPGRVESSPDVGGRRQADRRGNHGRPKRHHAGHQEGLVIRFRERDVRAIGRTARGVRGIRLDDTNHVIGMVVIQPDVEASILTVTERGFGKRTVATEYRTKGRAGRGVISIIVNERNGSAVSFHQVKESDEIMIMTSEGKILRTKVENLRDIGRNAQGVRLIDMEDTDRVVDVAKLAESADDEGSNGNNGTGNAAETNGFA